ncbi:HAD family hydrolase [bacterium]|nr:HAD family hydrolase [bacterium]
MFLDRDGVMNQPPPEGRWVFAWDEFHFAEGALDSLRRLREAGFVVVVVTNQSCVGRGLLDRSVVDDVHRRMTDAVEQAGGHLAAVFVCPHVDADGCRCRKPKAGMIEQAVAELGVEPATGFLVGDSERDIECGAAMGCTTFIVERPDKPPRESTAADHEVRDLAEAADAILAISAEGSPTP